MVSLQLHGRQDYRARMLNVGVHQHRRGELHARHPDTAVKRSESANSRMGHIDKDVEAGNTAHW